MLTGDEDWVMIDDTTPSKGHNSDMPQSSRDHMLSQVSTYIESISDELRAISLSIHDNPELRFREKHAHDLLTSHLQQHTGWKITPSAYGIGTAFVAVHDGHASGPAVSFNAEYDALPGIGHACGHNLIAIVSVAAALATAEFMRQNKIAGRVVLFGTPAEGISSIWPTLPIWGLEYSTALSYEAEGGGGKIKLLNAGAYSDYGVDISLISHPTNSPDAAAIRTAAFAQYTVEYHGKEAHAGARPWEGINALDALIAAINNVSLMRQQTEPGDLIQYRISNGGLKPNIIHAYAAGVFVLRAPTLTRLQRLQVRFHACLAAGAAATGAKLEVKEGLGYKNHVPNQILRKSYAAHFCSLGGQLSDPNIENLTAVSSASTDQGDISHAMPSLSPEFWIRSEDEHGKPLGGPHTPDFERAARTPEAHHLALRVSKALACTAIDMLTQEELLDDAKREYRDQAAEK